MSARWWLRAVATPVAVALTLGAVVACGSDPEPARTAHTPGDGAERVSPPEAAVHTPSADSGGEGPVMDSPDRVVIPDIGVDADLVELGLRSDGSMATPDYDSNLAGWYTEGPMPGESGPAVIAAHVDHPGGGPDTFADLGDLEPGDEIVVLDADGDSFAWEVTGSGTYDKNELPYDEIWTETSEPLLRLITCTGPYTGEEYRDNLVVYADPVEGGAS